MKFSAKLRRVGRKSLIITIPIEVVDKLSLKSEQIKEFDIKNDTLPKYPKKVGGLKTTNKEEKK